MKPKGEWLNLILDRFKQLSSTTLLQLSSIVLLQCFQLAVIAGLVSSYIYVAPKVVFLPPLSLLDCYQRIPHDVDIYRLALIYCALAISAVLVSSKIQDRAVSWHMRFGICLLIEAVVLVLLVKSLNLTIVPDHAHARPATLFVIMFWTAILTKVLVFKLLSPLPCCGDVSRDELQQAPFARFKYWLTFGALAMMVIAALWCIDIQSVVASAYIWERQAQNHIFVIGPAYWFYHGGLPNVDGYSLYGLGLPMIFGGICSWFHRFDYGLIFQIAVVMMIGYSLLWASVYLKLLRSITLAMAAVLLYLNFRLMGPEGGIIHSFITFNATPIRFMGDVILIAVLIQHWISRHPRWITFAAIITGGQLFLVTSSGISLFVLSGWYFVLVMMTQGQTGGAFLRTLGRFGLIAGMVFAGLTLFFYKGNVLDPLFWSHFFQQLRYFQNGMWCAPHIGSLARDMDIFGYSLFLIAFYVLSFIVALRWLIKNGSVDARVMILSLMAVYGIFDYQHFMMVSKPNVLFRNATIPLTMGLMYVSLALDRCGIISRRIVHGALVLMAAGLLMANPQWQGYPNIFHPKAQLLPTASNEEVKKYFKEATAFSDDVALIQSLTTADERVAIISEHEMPLYMHSKRKPFFYVFPLIGSGPLGRVVWPANEICSKEMLDRLVDSITRKKPRVVFINRKFWIDNIPSEFMNDFYGIVVLINTIRQRYEPVASSTNLIALRLRP